VRISGSNAGYTVFRGSVKVLATRSIRQIPLHFPSMRQRVPSHLNWSVALSSPKLSKTFYRNQSSKEILRSLCEGRNYGCPYMITVCYAHFHSHLRYDMIFGGGDNDSNPPSPGATVTNWPEPSHYRGFTMRHKHTR